MFSSVHKEIWAESLEMLKGQSSYPSEKKKILEECCYYLSMAISFYISHYLIKTQRYAGRRQTVPFLLRN